MISTKLGNVARIFNGNSINEKVKAKNFVGLLNGTPYIATKDISYTYLVDYENGVRIPASNESEFKVAKKGAVLLCAEGGSAGRKMAIIDRDVFFGNKLFCFECNTKLNSKFLFYYLQAPTFQDLFKSSITGLIGGVSLEKVRNLPIVLPSLEKQVEIVKKLDSAFAEIDLLESNLGVGEEKASQLLQSILSSAFSSDEDENDSSNPSDNQLTVRKLVSLGEVCTVVNGGTPDTKNSKFWNGQHAWITPAEMGNLKSPFLVGSKRTLTDEGLSNSSAQLVPKHSVIMSSRAPIGHLVINEIPMASNQGCKALIPNKNLNYKYLYYFLYASKQYLNEIGSGTTFAEISGSKLKTVLIPLQSLQKQKEVVEKLDGAFTEVELLKAQIRTKKDYSRALRQSLLSNAFTQEEAVA